MTSRRQFIAGAAAALTIPLLSDAKPEGIELRCIQHPMPVVRLQRWFKVDGDTYELKHLDGETWVSDGIYRRASAPFAKYDMAWHHGRS